MVEIDDYEEIYYNDEKLIFDTNGKCLFIEHNNGVIEYSEEDEDWHY